MEILDDQRGELLRIAAARGLKGFSQLIQEAIADFIAVQRQRQGAIAKALATRGCLEEADAESMRAARHRLR